MNADQPNVPRVVAVLWAAALLAVVLCGATAFAATTPKRAIQVAGTWKGSYNGAFSGKFTLRWTQSKGKLTGTITLSNPPGRYGITGSVTGSTIKFGVVAAGATYTGSVSDKGNSMSGRYKTPRGGGGWSAHKR